MVDTYLYRLRSREILKISRIGQEFRDLDPEFFAGGTNPTLPNGYDVREELPDGTLGPLRQLGFAKILDADGTTVRNATQQEIDTFLPAEQQDKELQAQDRAAQVGLDDDVFKILTDGILAIIMMVNNAHTDSLNDWRSEILQSRDFVDFKTRMTQNTSELDTHTIQSLRTDLEGVLRRLGA